MDPMLVAVIGLVILFLLMFLGLHVGVCMLLVGFVGVGVLTTMDVGLSILGTSTFATTSSYMFTVLPLFVLMGLIAYEGGLVTDLFSGLYKLLGSIHGGLSIAVICWCAAFAAITGETIAASMIMSKMAFPEMKKYHYDSKLAAGTIAAGGTLGILIPPSAAFVLYGMITETNIGALLIAGIFPGILLSALFIGSIYIRVRMNPKLALPGPKYSAKERRLGLSTIWPVVLIFGIVIGGIYAGIFTPTEAGAIGVFLAIVLVLIKRKFTGKGFTTALRDSMQGIGMVFAILIGAMVFNYFLTLSTLPMRLADIVVALGLSPYIILLACVVILLILGALMDEPAMIVLTMPIMFPVVTKGSGMVRRGIGYFMRARRN